MVGCGHAQMAILSYSGDMKRRIRPANQRSAGGQAQRSEEDRSPGNVPNPQCGQAGDAFAAFTEWFSEADEKAYGEL